MYHKNKTDNGIEYIRQYPKLKKWVHTCVCCGCSGYDPNMPEMLTANWGQGEVKTVKAHYIKKYFKPMSVNDLGMCEVCQKLQSKL